MYSKEEKNTEVRFTPILTKSENIKKVTKK